MAAIAIQIDRDFQASPELGNTTARETGPTFQSRQKVHLRQGHTYIDIHT